MKQIDLVMAMQNSTSELSSDNHNNTMVFYDASMTIHKIFMILKVLT